MNIKILDSWLREYLDTKASVKQIADLLSLSSVSVERVARFKNDFIYDIEVTTNRPELMSVVGIAKESAAVLNQNNIKAKFIKPLIPHHTPKDNLKITIKNDPTLVNRICAAILEVTQKQSPEYIKDRLEASGIRSLNNVVDVTNYLMRETGHPVHVFDYDRLTSKILEIREAKKGEKVVTLDGKEHILLGGDIVADNGKGEIVDLLGVMGTQNSVVTNGTKRILLFLDDNEAHHIRKTSMSLGIRSEAAILNEKGIDPELSLKTLQRGIELYYKIADAKLLSDNIDIYPNKPKPTTITVSEEKINTIIGIPIPLKTASGILNSLGFNNTTDKDTLKVSIPSIRLNDVTIAEDIVEEIARIYGYHNIPSKLPPLTNVQTKTLQDNEFYWEKKIKDALKYWGFTEVYTYSIVSQDMYEGPLDRAVTLQNPLGEEFSYMRKTLIPSLLQISRENKSRDEIKIFELSNIYVKNGTDLPKETLMLAGLIKNPHVSFFEVKGIIEQLLADLGIHNVQFSKRTEGGLGANIRIVKEYTGYIELLDQQTVDFELNFEIIKKHVSLKKIYKGLPKYPPIIEDLALVVSENIQTADIIEEIKKSVRQAQDKLSIEVSLLDQYENSRTFHIVYQHKEKNLTNEEVSQIRKKIIRALAKQYNAEPK